MANDTTRIANRLQPLDILLDVDVRTGRTRPTL